MKDHHDKFSAFKADFPRQLDALIEEHRAELGNDLSHWRVRYHSDKYIHFDHVKHQNGNGANGTNGTNGKSTRSSRLENVPKDLSPEERLYLREYINTQSVEHGFTPIAPRITQLSGDIIDALKTVDEKGNPNQEAWRIYADKHWEHFLRVAEDALQNKMEVRKTDRRIQESEAIINEGQESGKAPIKAHKELKKAKLAREMLEKGIIMGPEDVVNEALAETQRQYREGKLAKAADNVSSIISRNIYQVVHKYAKPEIHWTRQQSDKRNFRRLVDPGSEFDEGIGTALRQQLPEILEKAKSNMDGHQRDILDVMLKNHEEGNKPLTVKAIAGKLGRNRGCTSQDVDFVNERIRKAAHDLGYDETAAYIEHMLSINSKKNVILRG